MKFLGLLGCFWSLVALGQEDRPDNEPQGETLEAPASQRPTAPSPGEPQLPKHKRLYITAGALWTGGFLLEMSDENLESLADEHILSEEEGTPQEPNLRALRGLELTTYSSEGLFLGSLVALGQARYQKTQKARSLYLSSASLMAYSWIQLLNGVAIGFANDTPGFPSATEAANGNFAAGFGAFSLSVLVFGQAVWKSVTIQREHKLPTQSIKHGYAWGHLGSLGD